MTGRYPKHSAADYLAGYVAGYWAGYDFAVDEPSICDECGNDPEARTDCLACGRTGYIEGEGEDEPGTAAGGASAPTTAPAADPSARSASSASRPDGREPEGSPASAVSSLPAIHQPAAPGEGEAMVRIAGELERIHAHRGMVAGLNAFAEFLTKLGRPDCAEICRAAAQGWDVDEVLR